MINNFIPWQRNRDKFNRLCSLQINLENWCFTIENFRYWVKNLPFEPVSLNHQLSNKPFNSSMVDYYFENMVNQTANDFEILGPAIPDSFFPKSFSLGLGRRLGISYGMDGKNSGMEVLHPYLAEKGFIAAFYYQSDYVIWQSKKLLEKYKYRGGLKVYTDKYRQKVVDLSSRPGRWAKHPKFNYCGASKIWFGPSFYEIIPQERILSFEGGAVELSVLQNNVTYVHLYESVFDGDDPHNQKVQKAFREHLRIDEITQQA